MKSKENNLNFEIIVKAPVVYEQILVACSACPGEIYVQPIQFSNLKVCPFCSKQGSLFATYTTLAVPTMEEVEEATVDLTVTGVRVGGLSTTNH